MTHEFVPTPSLCHAVFALPPDTGLVYKDELIAARLTQKPSTENIELCIKTSHSYSQSLTIVRQLYDITSLLSEQITKDFHLLTHQKQSQKVPKHVRVFGDQLFVEEEVSLKDAVFDTSAGPVFIGKGASIEIGALLQGPCVCG